MMRKDPRIPVSFWVKVRLGNNDCWEWTGWSDIYGYGKCAWAGRREMAYRVTYMVLVAPIPEGLQLDHLCRNPPCVNPAHLEPVTGLENMRRRYSTYTHCVNGHEFTNDNTYVRPNGRRDCRTCIRERVYKYRARRAA